MRPSLNYYRKTTENTGLFGLSPCNCVPFIGVNEKQKDPPSSPAAKRRRRLLRWHRRWRRLCRRLLFLPRKRRGRRCKRRRFRRVRWWSCYRRPVPAPVLRQFWRWFLRARVEREVWALVRGDDGLWVRAVSPTPQPGGTRTHCSGARAAGELGPCTVLASAPTQCRPWPGPERDRHGFPGESYFHVDFASIIS